MGPRTPTVVKPVPFGVMTIPEPEDATSKRPAIRLQKVETQVVRMNEPFSRSHPAHRVTPERPVTLVDFTPVHLVGELPVRKSRANLRA